jgi:hypothetical protein
VGGEPTAYSQQWYKYDTTTQTYVPISGATAATYVLPPALIEANHDMRFMVVGKDSLYESYACMIDTGPPPCLPTFLVSDTVYFSIRGVDSLVAMIDTTQDVQVRGGNRIIYGIPFANPNSGSVPLGEKLRIVGMVDGGMRSDTFGYLYDWTPHYDLDRSNPRTSSAWLGKEIIDTTTVFTELILDPQIFYFAVYDTNAEGCFSMDSVVIEIQPLVGTKEDWADIPGAFSPHPGGNNPIFMPNVDEITILNRWGGVIYEAKGPDAKKGWNGRHQQTNRLVDRGDYFYIVTIYENNDKNKPNTKTGVVTVL